eukprot:SAG11_NODE_13900_length_634_cov_0.928972_2_plen_39_part_01
MLRTIRLIQCLPAGQLGLGQQHHKSGRVQMVGSQLQNML